MVLDRIKKYIDFKGVTIAAFERSIGMSNASFGKSLKNKGAIGSDKIEKILSVYPDLSPTWLLTGSGSMLLSNGSNTISGDISNSAVSTAGPAINTVGQHSVELQTENHHLQQRISDLERLLDEKERLISILLSKQ